MKLNKEEKNILDAYEKGKIKTKRPSKKYVKEVKKIQPEVEIEAKLKQEFKHLGSKKNLHNIPFWQYDYYKDEVMLVIMDRKEVMIDLKGKPVKKARAVINPRLPMYQALNYKNARRKADNIKANIFNELLRINREKQKKAED